MCGDPNKRLIWLTLIGVFDMLLGAVFVLGGLFLASRLAQLAGPTSLALIYGFLLFGCGLVLVAFRILQQREVGRRLHVSLAWVTIPALMALVYLITGPVWHWQDERSGLPEWVMLNLGVVAIMWVVASSFYLTKPNVKQVFTSA